VPAGAEADAFGGVRRIWVKKIEVADQAGDVGEAVRRGVVAGGVALRVGLERGRGRRGRHAGKHNACEMPEDGEASMATGVECGCTAEAARARVAGAQLDMLREE
jgi:hypothetical protein